MNKEEVWNETKTSRFQKARYQEACNEIQDESCYSKNASGKTLLKEPKKVKVKMVNSSAPSDMEIET